MKNWSIKQKESTGRWVLSFSDMLSQNDLPSIDDIYSECEANGLSRNSLVREEVIKNYLNKNANTGEKPMSLELELDPNFDARIIVNSDKTEAKLYIRKEVSLTKPLDMQIISRVLQRSNIAKLDIPAIKQKIKDFTESSDREFIEIIATGIQPKRGADKKLIAKFEQIPPHEVERLADRLKRLDLRSSDVEDPTTDRDYPLSEAETLTTVQKDDIIYSIDASELGEAGTDIYGNPIQGLPGNDPFLLDLRNIIQTHNELRAGITGLLLIANTERGLKLRIVPYRNATMRAVVSRDKMEATLILKSGLGAGERLSVVGIKKALNDVNLIDKLTDDKINEMIDLARKKTDESEFVFAQGSPAIAPNSYKLEWIAHFDEGVNATTIEKDELILKAKLCKKGEAGKDVFGTTINPKNAEPIELPAHDNSVNYTEKNGETQFYATVSGELSRFDNTIIISSLKSMRTNIDDSTGDVKFPGNLIITGDIKDNRKVKANGDLTITGNAERSLVYSEASVHLNGGINGKGSGTVWAKNTAELHYAENARIFSGGDIKITNYCFKCLVKTNGKLCLIDTPAVLLGGVTSVAQGLVAKELGAKKTIRTIISFGQDYLIKDEIEVREKEISENNTELEQINKKLNSNDKSLNIEELRERKVKLIKRNSALTIRIFNLKENFEIHIPSKIEVTGFIYPGVVLESHGRYFEIMETRHNVFFEFDQKTGQIICTPISDEKI